MSHKFDKPIPATAIMKRSESGRNLSYIDGYYAITVANERIGHGNWSYKTDNFTIVQCEQKKNSSNQDRWYVAYIATCEVTADFDDKTVVRGDVGYGSGIDADLGRAHESAAKESATDALKRALRSLGESFGLQLYDKTGGKTKDALESDSEPKRTSNGKPKEPTPTQKYVTSLKLTTEQSAAIQKVDGYATTLKEAAKDNWPKERVLDTFGLEVSA